MNALPSCRDCSAPATLFVAGIPLCEACYTAAGSCCNEREEEESSPSAPASPPCLAHEFDDYTDSTQP